MCLSSYVYYGTIVGSFGETIIIMDKRRGESHKKDARVTLVGGLLQAIEYQAQGIWESSNVYMPSLFGI